MSITFTFLDIYHHGETSITVGYKEILDYFEEFCALYDVNCYEDNETLSSKDEILAVKEESQDS